MASAASPSPRLISESTMRFKDRVRSPGDLQRLSDFEHRIYLPLLLSAVLPIVTAASRASEDSWVFIGINIAAWLVFVTDLVVHVRLVKRYLRSGIGIFDLVVVIITAPWFLIPGLGGSQILMVARLARLVRLLFVSKAARRAVSRLGKVGLFSLGMLLFCAWAAYVAEHPSNPEFASYRDALWWGIVTMTTVGYGDIVPDTDKGRIAGTFLMLTGIATLGIISGTLASVFRLSPGGSSESQVPAPAASATGTPGPAQPTDNDVALEVAGVRSDLAAIDQRLAALGAASGTATPPAPSTQRPGAPE